jgi:annexin A7/11
VPVDPQQVEHDVRTLYNAGEGRSGTDEITFCNVIINRSDNQLRAIAQAYKRHHHHTLEHAIQSEFSGHMRHVLLHIVEGAINPMARDAVLIERSMEGAGTKDERLTYRIVRAYWEGGRPHLEGVKEAYHRIYKQSLVHRVKGETSGDFERLLVAILKG